MILSILYWFSLQIIEYHESKSINSSFIQDSHKCTVLWLKLIFEPIKGEVLTNKAFPENLITLLPFLMFLNLSLEYVNIYNFVLLHFFYFLAPCPVLTVTIWPAYRFLRRQVRWSGIPISWWIFHSLLWPTQSKALA